MYAIFLLRMLWNHLNQLSNKLSNSGCNEKRRSILGHNDLLILIALELVQGLEISQIKQLFYQFCLKEIGCDKNTVSI
jgi:hypothetical protein